MSTTNIQLYRLKRTRRGWRCRKQIAEKFRFPVGTKLLRTSKNWPDLNTRRLAAIHLATSSNTLRPPMKWWLEISLHPSFRGTCVGRCRLLKMAFSISRLSQDSNCPPRQCKNFSGLKPKSIPNRQSRISERRLRLTKTRAHSRFIRSLAKRRGSKLIT